MRIGKIRPSAKKAVAVACFAAMCLTTQASLKIDVGNPPIRPLGNVTVEMSLKPFKKVDREYIEAVCRTVFEQWKPLLEHADTVSVMLWTSDGSEILDYAGDPNQVLSWGQYVGNPNAPAPINSGPRSLTIHERAYDYIDNPPVFTYGDLRFIVSALRKAGSEITGKVIRVGETFDPGPEFAISSFKYEHHPEICMANTLGAKSFVVCYATLNEDSRKYAAYPRGIPQGEPLGLFLGRQANVFLRDMGFDYLWLSNGFGFGMETWNTVGAIFDGESFRAERMADIQEKILDFWTKLRQGMPDFPIETRGTNLSTGIDLARDGVDLKSIYDGGFNILPPPNSPWAALDGDFGLELTGYMSRISEIPDDRYLFRYYTHDPWWANSPWLDRYGRSPHDIYLPMSIARIDEKGRIALPTNLNILTIDDSYGNMPDQVPQEVIPHILQARRHAPDRAGEVVWVYPFDEYHDMAFGAPERLPEIFYGDWFVRQALNDGFPMNTVVSTRNFVKLTEDGSDVFDASILVTIVPEAGSRVEKHLMKFVSSGGKAIVYGPADHASREFLKFMGVDLAVPLQGEFSIEVADNKDTPSSAAKLKHDARFSGGGFETIAAGSAGTEVFARAIHDGNRRDAGMIRSETAWNGGAVCYVRGTNSASYTGGMLLQPDDPAQFFTGGSILRMALAQLGYEIFYDKPNLSVRTPVNTISRHDNGYWFAGYVPNQTVGHRMKFPQGAPLFVGHETVIEDGYATYRMAKSWFAECRVFIVQDEGMVTCREIPPTEWEVKRKIGISGLKNARLRVYPYAELSELYDMSPGDNHYPDRGNSLVSVRQSDATGVFYEYEDVSGSVTITW